MAQLVVVVSVPAVLPNLAMTNVAQVGMSADEVLRRAVEHVATVAGHRLVLHSVELLKQEETPVAVTLPPRLA